MRKFERFDFCNVTELDDEKRIALLKRLLSTANGCTLSQTEEERSTRSFVLRGQPEAWERTTDRRGGGRVTTTKTRQAEDAIAWMLKAHRWNGWSRDGNFAVAAIFLRRNRQTVDADNLMKLFKDGVTKSGKVWRDDAQATLDLSWVDVDPKDPRTVVVISRHGATRMRR